MGPDTSDLRNSVSEGRIPNVPQRHCGRVVFCPVRLPGGEVNFPGPYYVRAVSKNYDVGYVYATVSRNIFTHISLPTL